MAAAAKLGWKVVGVGSGLVAGKVARSALTAGWRRTRGGDPPRNPASPSTDWAEAVSWAVASGVALGLARLLATKSAASVWQKVTGSLPPGLEDVGA